MKGLSVQVSPEPDQVSVHRATVKVPQDVLPGQEFQVTLPSVGRVTVVCPPGALPGSTTAVDVPVATVGPTPTLFRGMPTMLPNQVSVPLERRGLGDVYFECEPDPRLLVFITEAEYAELIDAFNQAVAQCRPCQSKHVLPLLLGGFFCCYCMANHSFGKKVTRIMDSHPLLERMTQRGVLYHFYQVRFVLENDACMHGCMQGCSI